MYSSALFSTVTIWSLSESILSEVFFIKGISAILDNTVKMRTIDKLIKTAMKLAKVGIIAGTTMNGPELLPTGNRPR
jgi:hypothetical protein